MYMPRPQCFVFFDFYFKDKHFTYLCAKSLQAYVCYNFSIKVIAKRMGWHSNKSENTGITSVDRSTKATLSTYNPWIQVSRLQKIYHFQHKKLRFTKLTLTFNWFTRKRWRQQYETTVEQCEGNGESIGEHKCNATLLLFLFRTRECCFVV